jgi:hypothetical protein
MISFMHEAVVNTIIFPFINIVTFFCQLSGLTLFHYEAPEVHASGSTSDRSDVYSFGVVMLELLTGRKPYDR